MKHLKSTPFIFFGALALVILCSSFLGQESRKKYLTMNVVLASITEFKIVIITEEGKIEEVPMEKSKISNEIENAKIKTQTLNNLSTRGYELLYANGGQYIFEKK